MCVYVVKKRERAREKERMDIKELATKVNWICFLFEESPSLSTQQTQEIKFDECGWRRNISSTAIGKSEVGI